MRNLKKVLSVLLVVAMLATAMVPAFAASETSISADAKICADIGMLLGEGSDGVTPEYTATTLTRIQAAIMSLRLQGLAADAAKFDGKDNFADVEDDDWFAPYTAYLKAHPELGFIGDGKNFDAEEKISAQQYYKIVLTALGYVEGEGKDFLYADTIEFAAEKGLKKVDGENEELTVDDVAVATVEGLKATVKGGTKTLATTLVEAKKLDADKAEKAGIYKPSADIDVKSAVALNSKVVEVELNTAVTNVSASDVTVKDAAGATIAVKSAEIAPYVTNGKKVLVTLEKDTASGTLYTLTANGKSVNFGGRAIDTSKPLVKSVTAPEYNQVVVEFDEPIKLNNAKFEIAQSYNEKTALKVLKVEYDGSSKALLTTEEQQDSTLYTYVITGVEDYAGNVIDKAEDFFPGTKKPTDALEVKEPAAFNEPEEITVEFNVNVDPSTILPENFKVEDIYSTNKEVLPVASARLAKKDEVGVDGTTKFTDVTKKRAVILSVPGSKESTLYQITVSGMKTLYGKDMSSTAGKNSTTAVGKAKPTTAFDYTISGGSAASNTSVEIDFDRKVQKEFAENIANYAIKEAYPNSDSKDVTITKAELKDNGKTVKLTTSSLRTVLYEITINNIKDIYGNSIKTDSKANVDNFSGVAVADKISAISSIEYVSSSENRVIRVTFNQNVGSNAADVSLYTIDNGIGYVEKAATVSGNNKQVDLTIPKLTDNKVYTLTVKGLYNADGIAMDSAGISSTFLGKGVPATKPELAAVMAVDNQTIKVFFDRPVADSSIKGKVWVDATPRTLKEENTFVLEDAAGNKVNLGKAYASPDPENKNALIIRVATETFSSKKSSSFKLIGDATFKSDKNTLPFAYKNDDPKTITIDGIMAVNSRVLRVYFNQPVYGTLNAFAIISTTKDGAAEYTLSSATAVDTTNKVYEFAVVAVDNSNKALGTGSYWLKVNTDYIAVNNVVTDRVDKENGFVGFENKDTNLNKQFAGSGTEFTKINSISVIMTDAKTMKVYYPVKMNADKRAKVGESVEKSVLDPVNYAVYKADEKTLATMENGSSFAASDIAKISYDAADNSTTITFAQKIKETGAKLAIKETVASATGTAFVKTDSGSQVFKQFAVGTADAAKVTVSGATYAKEGTLKITFSQPVTTDLTTAANVVKALKITLKDKDGKDFEVKAENIDTTIGKTSTSQTGDAIYVESVKDITLTFKGIPELKADAVGKVQIISDDIKGINGQTGNKDASWSFSQN